MARRRKEIVMPHLNDCGGDLTKKWYVEYSIRNPRTEKMERVRHYDGLNKFSTYNDRFDYAQTIIEDYTQKICSGEISFKELIQYDDLLLYNGQKCFSPQRAAHIGSIKIYISEFLKEKSLELKEDTIRTYTSEFRIFCLYAEKKGVINKPATYYTKEFITEFLKELVREKKLSKVTISKYKQLLRGFFEFLRKKKIIVSNPAEDIPVMGITKDKAPAAIPKYMRELLQKEIEPNDPQLWLFLCFQYYMAIRPRKELRLMRLNQINYDSRTITVMNVDAKNSETETVDIPDQLYSLITDKWKLHTYDQSYYVFGEYNAPGETCRGKNNMTNRFNAFRNKLNLPISVKLYSWKHSGAQELADSGASIYEIQRHLRHRDITTTEKYLKKRIGQRSNKIKHNFPEI